MCSFPRCFTILNVKLVYQVITGSRFLPVLAEHLCVIQTNPNSISWKTFLKSGTDSHLCISNGANWLPLRDAICASAGFLMRCENQPMISGSFFSYYKNEFRVCLWLVCRRKVTGSRQFQSRELWQWWRNYFVVVVLLANPFFTVMSRLCKETAGNTISCSSFQLEQGTNDDPTQW